MSKPDLVDYFNFVMNKSYHIGYFVCKVENGIVMFRTEVVLQDTMGSLVTLKGSWTEDHEKAQLLTFEDACLLMGRNEVVVCVTATKEVLEVVFVGSPHLHE